MTPTRDVRLLPKAHLHVHLESAVRWPTLGETGTANGVEIPARLLDGGHAFTGFADFFAQNALVRSCLRRPEDFRRIAYEFCEDEAANGTRYAEVSFTAAAHGERLGDLDMPLVSVLEGLAAGREAFGTECRVLLDHSRRRSVERAWRTLELAERYARDGVVGIGVAGDEAHPVEPFAEVFAAARKAGLHTVHHAGEACGADSIRAALDIGGAERIGHGIRILDDDELVADVRERRIPLEVCPSSNVALGFAASLRVHPLERLRAAGLVVTLSTDIPSMINVSLAREYALVRDAFGYDDAVLADFARAGVDASFAPAGTKARLHTEIDGWIASGS
ncbi:adenosine deaminase [Streptomyces sp. H10-C2]|uniref:adenosine deaminase n=1 Tax=unclassified Streptomyces TaxID=2593676 RepID=UPI0024BAA2F5|nr:MULTISPECIES: adenosine deaminase [unclassified Streptomyces]MDJ0341849.1 adenosine deaminase [Streptomyces sp. PH10-H1]MDJ0370397.1 adenosine deaminase [Streptomyces sp. H10-C2]